MGAAWGRRGGCMGVAWRLLASAWGSYTTRFRDLQGAIKTVNDKYFCICPLCIILQQPFTTTCSTTFSSRGETTASLRRLSTCCLACLLRPHDRENVQVAEVSLPGPSGRAATPQLTPKSGRVWWHWCCQLRQFEIMSVHKCTNSTAFITILPRFNTEIFTIYARFITI